MRITTPDTLLRIYDYDSYIRFSAGQATSLVSLLVCFFTAATDLWFRLSLLQSIQGEAFDSSRCCSLVLQLPAGPLARCGSGRVRLYHWEAWSERENSRKKRRKSSVAFKIKSGSLIRNYFNGSIRFRENYYITLTPVTCVRKVLNYFKWQIFGKVTGSFELCGHEKLLKARYFLSLLLIFENIL